MKSLATILLVLGIALVGLFLFTRNDSVEGEQHLTVYCAAGLKTPVEAIADAYTAETGVQVRFQFGGTGTLLSQIRVSRSGDLFIAADQGAIDDARTHGVIHEVLPILTQRPVIAVQEGNPKGITTLDDLFHEDLRVAVANPGAASIGRITQRAVGDRWEQLEQHVKVMKPTVTELAGDLTLGSIDAAIIWDSIVSQFAIDAVHTPELDACAEQASAAVIHACTQPALALQFARYLSAPEKGGVLFTRHGFTPTPGDVWESTPAMLLYSGGVNRPAIEQLLRDFAEREGVEINTVFNGCGILCASMKTMLDDENARFPDAYFACDLCFVPPVAKHFPEADLLTETRIGIVVPRGNPEKINTLADLARPGLKLGLCNAEQSTLGYMTSGMIRSAGLQKSIGANVAVEVPTADFLINQMRVGALDAAIVYEVNATLQAEHLDFLPIDHKGARAVQPFAVHEGSPHTLLAGRLLAYLKNHREAFEGSGFQWIGGSPVQSDEIEVPDWLAPTPVNTP